MKYRLKITCVDFCTGEPIAHLAITKAEEATLSEAKRGAVDIATGGFWDTTNPTLFVAPAAIQSVEVIEEK